MPRPSQLLQPQRAPVPARDASTLLLLRDCADGKGFEVLMTRRADQGIFANAYVFPGLGLGILASKAARVTEGMLIACSKTLAAHSPLATREVGGLLPSVEEIEMISRAIAAEVARAAQRDGVAPQIDEAQLAANIDKMFWRARYTAYKRSPF